VNRYILGESSSPGVHSIPLQTMVSGLPTNMHAGQKCSYVVTECILQYSHTGTKRLECLSLLSFSSGECWLLPWTQRMSRHM